MSTAEPSGTPPTSSSPVLGLMARHQTAALVATAVDFLSMIVWVETGLGGAVSGAAVGAACGAICNFLLGRSWIFQATGRPAVAQAVRYAMVSAGSLGWNTLGQYLLLRSTDLPYVATRVVIAALVGLAWNFPLHRHFVFPGGLRDTRDRS